MAEKFSSMEEELNSLRTDKQISEYKAKFIAQGYEEKLAEDTAKAMAEGDTAKVFANQSKFLEEYGKKIIVCSDMYLSERVIKCLLKQRR